jgi:hypothetical protein
MQLLDLRAKRLSALVCLTGTGEAGAAKPGAKHLFLAFRNGQHFCPTCGIAVIRTSTQFPPPVSVNARCLEEVDIAALKIRRFDGRHEYP